MHTRYNYIISYQEALTNFHTHTNYLAQIKYL
jgi:hypothetical protein